MAFCSRHGGNESFSSSCPLCAAEERHRESLDEAQRLHDENLEATKQAQQALAASLERSNFLRMNPGDFACPHCKHITLKRAATRCPWCQGVVEQSYWAEIEAREAATRGHQAALAAARAREAEKIAAARARHAVHEETAKQLNREKHREVQEQRYERLSNKAVPIFLAVLFALVVAVATLVALAHYWFR